MRPAFVFRMAARDLLGGVGVASAAVIFVRRRHQSIAALRYLGATAIVGPPAP